MTIITKESYRSDPRERPVYVVRSTDLKRPEAFRWLSDAIAFCRHIGLPYHVN